MCLAAALRRRRSAANLGRRRRSRGRLAPSSQGSHAHVVAAPACCSTLRSASWHTRYSSSSTRRRTRRPRRAPASSRCPGTAGVPRGRTARRPDPPDAGSAVDRHDRGPDMLTLPRIAEAGPAQRRVGVIRRLGGGGQPHRQARQLLHGPVVEVSGDPPPLPIRRADRALHQPLALGLARRTRRTSNHARGTIRSANALSVTTRTGGRSRRARAGVR